MELAREHPLVDIRHHQHNGETDWLSVAQEGITEVLRCQDTVHANDLVALGLPPEACNVAGSAFASYRNKGWIVSTGERRASTRPSRNCAKSFTYRATSKFPATAGVRAGDTPLGSARQRSDLSAPCTDSGGAGVGASGGFASLPSVAASVHPGDKGSAGGRPTVSSATPAEPAPLSLFEVPASEPEPPVSAVTGQRRAA